MNQVWSFYCKQHIVLILPALYKYGAWFVCYTSDLSLNHIPSRGMEFPKYGECSILLHVNLSENGAVCQGELLVNCHDLAKCVKTLNLKVEYTFQLEAYVNT